MKDSKYRYEVIVVLNPKAESKEKEKIIKTIEDKLVEMSFDVDNREDLGSKSLAYEVRGQEKGDFWVFNIGGAMPIKSKDFRLFLNRETNVIRYLILKI